MLECKDCWHYDRCLARDIIEPVDCEQFKRYEILNIKKLNKED